MCFSLKLTYCLNEKACPSLIYQFCLIRYMFGRPVHIIAVNSKDVGSSRELAHMK